MYAVIFQGGYDGEGQVVRKVREIHRGEIDPPEVIPAPVEEKAGGWRKDSTAGIAQRVFSLDLPVFYGHLIEILSRIVKIVNNKVINGIENI
ncbi:MAG: hypothetical protein WHT46_01290 [Candidatus Geothermincolales bacterium]